MPRFARVEKHRRCECSRRVRARRVPAPDVQNRYLGSCQNFQPSGAAGQDESGSQPMGGSQLFGEAGQFGGATNRSRDRRLINQIPKAARTSAMARATTPDISHRESDRSQAATASGTHGSEGAAAKTRRNKPNSPRTIASVHAAPIHRPKGRWSFAGNINTGCTQPM